MKRSRHGKYKEYERRILQVLTKEKSSISATQIRISAEIPKSSLYDVLRKLHYEGHIEWIGEPQDWISMIRITEKGRDYLKISKTNI